MPIFRFSSILFFVFCFFVLIPQAISQPPLPGHGGDEDYSPGSVSQFEVEITTANPQAGEIISLMIRAPGIPRAGWFPHLEEK